MLTASSGIAAPRCCSSTLRRWGRELTVPALSLVLRRRPSWWVLGESTLYRVGEVGGHLCLGGWQAEFRVGGGAS